MGAGEGLAESCGLLSSLAERQAGLTKSIETLLASLDARLPHFSSNTPTPDLSQLTSGFSALKFKVSKDPLLSQTRAPGTRVERTKLLGEAGKANFHLGTYGDDSAVILKAPPSPPLPTPQAPTSSTEGETFYSREPARRSAQVPRTCPTHGEAVKSPRVRHVVGGGGADRCVVLWVPQGRRGRRRGRRGRCCCCSRAGLLGLVVVMVVLRRVVVMVRVAHARAKLCVPRTRRKLTLEQGQGPGGSCRSATRGPCTPSPCVPAARARGPTRGVQVRSDAERANAERAALAGRAARPRHGHHQRGRHAQRDEKIWPGVRLGKRGRGP